jgi:hypothetical protein
MKSKQLFLAIALLLVAAGLWYGRTALQTDEPAESSLSARPANQETNGRDVPVTSTNGHANQHKMMPPDELRKFRDLSPEQRVRRARNPNGVGG